MVATAVLIGNEVERAYNGLTRRPVRGGAEKRLQG